MRKGAAATAPFPYSRFGFGQLDGWNFVGGFSVNHFS